MDDNQDTCTVYAILAAVLLWTALCNGVSASDVDTTCTSPVPYVLAVEDSPNGLHVTATAATPDDPDHEELTTLPDAHLPSQECGEGYTRCPLKCEENDAESMTCSFPVTSATTGTLKPYVVLLHLKQASERMGFQLVQEKLVPVPDDIDCVPIEVFDRGPNVDYRHIVACVNLTSQDARYVYFLLLEYDTANISSARLVADTSLSDQYYLIMEHSLSKLVYWEPSNTACVVPGNVFMKDGSRVVTFELRDSPRFRQLEEQHEIDDCPNTLDFSTFDTDLLRIQCSVGDVALYDVCRTETVVERYNATLNGTVYQCSNARLNLFLNGTFLDIRPYGSGRDDVMVNFTLPFDDIIRAQCTGKEIPVLFMTRRSGETYMLFLTSGQLFSLAQNSCLGESCLDSNILRTEYAYVIGMFDYNSNEYIVANLSCSESPVIAHVLYDSPPAQTTLALSNSTRPCHCPPQQPGTEPIQTPTDPFSEDPSTEAPNDSPSKEPSTQTSTGSQVIDEISVKPQGVNEDESVGRNHKAVIGGSGGAGGVVVLAFLIVVVVVILIAVYYWKRRQRSVQIKTESLASTPSTATIAVEVEDNSSHGSVVPGQTPIDPVMFHEANVFETYNKRGRGENKLNDLRRKCQMWAGASNF